VLCRAVPIVEAMVALVLVDALMQHTAQCGLLPGMHDKASSIVPNEVEHAKGKAKLGKRLFGMGGLL
jgi:hypothetical protein